MRLRKPFISFLFPSLVLLGISSSTLWADKDLPSTKENRHQYEIEKGHQGGIFLKRED